MAEITYLDFDILIEHVGEGYRARVLNSPAGQAKADFSLPFSDLELENFLLRMGQTRRSAVRDARIGEGQETEASKVFGQRLFTAVFAGDVQGCLRSSMDEASRGGARLRLRLRLSDAPELADLPWEYLYNSGLNRFLALSIETPLVRYLDLPEPIQPLAVTSPLRVLAVIANPSDYPPLDVEQEWTKLGTALADLQQRGQVVVERLPEARLSALQQQLRRGDYHILHFIGHGGFDTRAQDGVLVMQDQYGRGRLVSGQDLGTMLHDHRTMRLAILNACEGARASRTDPFAGTAQSLVQQRIPAVVAMQFEISDEAAITFSQEFYSALADGYPVDAALAEARKAIFAQGNKVEWGTPVLYTRASDGRIFNLARTSAAEPPLVKAAILAPQVQATESQAVPVKPASPAESPAQAQRVPASPGIKPMRIVGIIGILALLVALGAVILRATTPPAEPAATIGAPAVLPATIAPTFTPLPTYTLLPTYTPLPPMDTLMAMSPAAPVVPPMDTLMAMTQAAPVVATMNPSPTDTPVPTHTPTRTPRVPTRTPLAPVATVTISAVTALSPTLAVTPTLPSAASGGPLSFVCNFVNLTINSDGFAEWTIHVIASGGGGGYTYFHDGAEKTGPTFSVIGTPGKMFVHTIKVGSADGQTVAHPYAVSGAYPSQVDPTHDYCSPSD